jgi:pimeloyl-ACP methyl ester carboxylesterase
VVVSPNVPTAVSPVERFVRVRPDLSLRVLDHRRSAEVPIHVVMLHGLASIANLWNGVGAELSEAGIGAIAIDQRGHGKSDKPDGPYDMGTVADDLALFLEVEGIHRPLIAGQSWGGNVVIEFAARYPGRARGIVPVDGGFIDLQTLFPVWEDCQAKMAPPQLIGTPVDRVRGWIRQAHPDWTDTAVDDQVSFAEVRPDGTVAPWLTFDRHIRVLRGLWEHRPDDRFPSITDPVWWMVARNQDGGWAAQKETRLNAAGALLRHHRVTWFDGADHDLHAQHPAQVATLLASGFGEFFG